MGRQQPTSAVARLFNPAWVCALALSIPGLETVRAAADYPMLGREAPDFALHAVGGDNIRLSEHRGEVVVLSFWGIRCGSCPAQLQALDRSYSTYKSAGVQIYGVNVDDDQRRSQEMAGSYTVQFPILLDPRKGVSRDYRVDNLPMTLLIDRDGKVRYVHRDFSRAGEDLYLQQLRGLINE